jgi:hypothetical protein
MAEPGTDLLFPLRAIPDLAETRGPTWQALVASAIKAGPDSLEQMGFILLMARLNNCTNCSSDSYRAMNGCATCARQTLKRSRETDETLVEIYRATKDEVEQYLANK